MTECLKEWFSALIFFEKAKIAAAEFLKIFNIYIKKPLTFGAIEI